MSKTKHPRLIAAVFRNPRDAENAYDWLVRTGHTDISVLMSEATRAVRYAGTPLGEASRTLEGAAVGGAVGTAVGATLAAVAAIGTSVLIPGVGVVVGPLAAALAGAGAGAVAGGLVGALVGWGVPDAEAEAFEAVVREGGVALGVVPRGDEDPRAVEKTFRELHAEHVYTG